MSMLLLGGGGCIVAQRPLIEIFGRTPAQFIQQIHYWIQKNAGQEVEGLHWIYNTLEAWAEQLAVAPKTVQRAVGRLKDLGVLLVKNLNPYRVNRTLHYTLDYKRLEELCQQALQSLSPAPQDIPSNKETANAEPQQPLTETSSHETKCPDANGQNVRMYTKSTYKEPSHKSYKSNYLNRNFLDEGKQSSGDKPLPLKLLEIWNETVGAYVGVSSLTVKRAQWLASAFKYHFQSSLKHWKAFCQAITQSDFLIGKVKSSFKATLDWILRFDILQRIKEGQFGICLKSSETTSSDPKTSTELLEKISFLEEEQEIKNFRLGLIEFLGVSVYQSWFEDASMMLKEGKISVQFSSSFKKRYVETHYLDAIRSTFQEIEIALLHEQESRAA